MPIAGRIEGAPAVFPELIHSWAGWMATLNYSRKTIRSYRENVEKLAIVAGWAAPEDITPASIADAFTSKRSSKEWGKGTTQNRALYAVRSFAKWLKLKRHIRDDPTLEIPRAKDDGDEGARASTSAEAVAVIQVALAREQVLGYKKSARWLQHLLRYQAGLRDGEAGLFEWKRHMQLDAKVPHIHWTKDVNKNRRTSNVALHPELVEALRAHRENMRQLAKTMPEVIVKNKRRRNEGEVRVRRVNPDEPGAFVFPWVSSCFDTDAARAGVIAMDDRGRPFSSHSARKYFETELEAAGVSDKMIDFLMRHRGGVEMRYFDPKLDRQIAELSRLPSLMPRVMHNLPTGKDSSLTRRRVDGHDVADQGSADSKHITEKLGSPAEVAPWSVDDHAGLPGFAAAEEALRQAGNARGRLNRARVLNPEMPIGGFETPRDSNDLSDLFLSLARLLRQGERVHVERDQRVGGNGKRGNKAG